MGYFPNGTAGDMYEAKYCARCLHEDHDKGCPVMLLHLLYNYDECNNKGSFLHMLIPRDKEGWNEQCSMFIDKGGLLSEDEAERRLGSL